MTLISSSPFVIDFHWVYIVNDSSSETLHLAWCGKNQRQYVRRLHFHQMSASFHIPFEYTEHFINAFIRVGFALFLRLLLLIFQRKTRIKKPVEFLHHFYWHRFAQISTRSRIVDNTLFRFLLHVVVTFFECVFR